MILIISKPVRKKIKIQVDVEIFMNFYKFFSSNGNRDAVLRTKKTVWNKN